MVVRVGHIHAALYPFVIFPAMELAPLILGSGIGACSGFLEVFEFLCRRTGRFARLRGSSLGCAADRFTGALLVLGKFLFKGCGQSNQNLIVIGTLIVPLAGRLVVGVQVDHVGDEGTGVESGGLFHTLDVMALDVGKKIPGSISQLIGGECE